MKRILYLYMVFLMLFFLNSCKRNPLKVDISGIKENVEFVRFEKELFSLPLKDTLNEFVFLHNKYPGFFDWLVTARKKEHRNGRHEREHDENPRGEHPERRQPRKIHRKLEEQRPLRAVDWIG